MKLSLQNIVNRACYHLHTLVIWVCDDKFALYLIWLTLGVMQRITNFGATLLSMQTPYPIKRNISQIISLCALQYHLFLLAISPIGARNYHIWSLLQTILHKARQRLFELINLTLTNILAQTNDYNILALWSIV